MKKKWSKNKWYDLIKNTLANTYKELSNYNPNRLKFFFGNIQTQSMIY